MQFTDIELSALIKDGNENAFCQLIDRYGGLIKSIVKYHLKDLSMWHEDCINDILFAVWQNISSFDCKKNTMKNWIAAVAKYKSIDYKRKYLRDMIFCELDENIATNATYDTVFLRDELEKEIQSLLSALNEDDKEIFVRRFIMDQSIDEISQIKNKTPTYIYGRISRSRKKLKKLHNKNRT